MTHIEECKKELRQYIEPQKAELLPKFFQTFPGGYGEGDLFLGIRVPNIRKIAKKYKDFTFDELSILISDVYHEVRMLGLFILVIRFEKSKQESERKKIAEFFIKNIKFVNNWDLVDSSSHKILGAYLEDKDRQILYDYAKSGELWLQRIAIIATFWYIRKEDFVDALKVAEILVNHPHHLIQKAVGWMLREVGNRDRETEEQFLKKFYKTMPRTMLRYAIEKFENEVRQKYLKGLI